MDAYNCLLERLRALGNEKYLSFHKKLLCNEKINVIGVRMPALRKLAKEYPSCDELLQFPDEYYEVTMLKCLVIGALPFEEYCQRVDGAVKLIDNWATCDCFNAPCIRSHREEFLPYIMRYLNSGEEFVVRYALVTLLRYYVDKEYLPLIFSVLEACDCSKYYVHMAAAWLLAEVIVKAYGEGVAFLRTASLEKRTQNKAIQKARESFRLTDSQKRELLQYKM